MNSSRKHVLLKKFRFFVCLHSRLFAASRVNREESINIVLRSKMRVVSITMTYYDKFSKNSIQNELFVRMKASKSQRDR